ncbi:oligopeptide transporter [[Clostridium] sordellii]|uniref:ABC transporter substrate-binding protein n=1 Tax=Paraclostridium sordellii TaxID=1505 RepID=UPI0005E90B1A|nr:ABC transporter substrate-binding protein [Paeniclostridium sordellii]CEQ08481.1 oligopeptide transporter [[Clostridium] sordellii] [Paeniclostridium sordellii]
MLLKRKASILLSSLLISSIVLTGCSSTNKKESTSKNQIDPFKVLENEDARKAISLAIDKEQMTNVILNDGSKPVNRFVPDGLAFNEAGKDYREVAGEMGYGHNDDEAKKSWDKVKKELNFDTVEFEFLTTDTEQSKKIAEFIQSELQDALEGVTVKIQQLPTKLKTEKGSAGDFQLSIAGWGADYPDPLTFLEIYYPEVGRYAINVGYKDEEYKNLISKAKESTTIDESWDSYMKAEKILLDSGFITPLYQKGGAYLEKEYIKDVANYSFGPQTSYKWAKVSNGKNEINTTSSSDISSMDTAKASDSTSFETINNVMEGLVRVDLKNELIPGMAESWEKSSDAKTWTFKIRPDAKWSNGDPVTAHDFEYAFIRNLTPETACEYAYVMYDIKGAEDFNLGKTKDSSSVGVKAIDDHTLEVKLNRPVNYFDQLMAFPVFFPVNQKVVETYGDDYGTSKDKLVFNGPFVMDSWKIEDQYGLKKNEKYWDNKTVNLDKVNFKVVKDINAAVNLYETGEIDKVVLASEHVDKYKDSKEFKTIKYASCNFLMVNAGNPPKK